MAVAGPQKANSMLNLFPDRIKTFVFVIILFFVSGIEAAENGYRVNFHNYSSGLKSSVISQSVSIAAIRVQFVEDDEEGTTGNGLFDLSSPSAGDDFIFDPPPHNRRYFQAHLESLNNYFNSVGQSRWGIGGINSTVFPLLTDSVYDLQNPMRFYSPKSDEETNDKRLAQLFYESVILAADDAGNYSGTDLVIVFHAGVGKDFTFQLDLTPFDIPSALLDRDFLQLNLASSEFSQLESLGVTTGLILPETQSQDGFNIALNGTITLLFGRFLGLPSLWNTDTGDPGIGKWGLMDQGSNNMDGAVPARPSAFSRVFMGWELDIPAYPSEGREIFTAADEFGIKYYSIKINSDEYFLIENRSRATTNKTGFEELIVGRDTAYVKFDSLGSGVIVSVSNYDAGIPGSGLLIWHINESVVKEFYSTNRINTDKENRGVDLEEGDGSQDIGEEFGFLQPGGGSENGTPWDPFYAKNPAWYFQNPDWEADADSTVAFTPETSPNSNSNAGGKTGISITNISKAGLRMTFDVASSFLAVGFPLYLGAGAGRSFPAVADLDGDGNIEILVATSDGTIHGWTLILDRLPLVYLGGGDTENIVSTFGNVTTSHRIGIFADSVGSISNIAISDIDGDDTLEVVVVTKNGKVIMYEPEEGAVIDNRADSAWSIYLGEEVLATPIVSNGRVYVGSLSGTISEINSSGNLINSTASAIEILSMTLPDGEAVKGSNDNIISGNIWRAGNAIVTLSAEGVVKVFASTNSDLIDADYEYDIGDSVLSSPAIADINKDGDLEIIITGNNKLWAFNGNLTLVENFPVTIGIPEPVGKILSSPVIGDVDGDGSPEIIFGAPDGKIYGYHSDGTVAEGFPLSTGASVSSTPVIVDAIPSGAMEIVATSDDGWLYMWSVPGNGDAGTSQPYLPWSAYAGSNERKNYAPFSKFGFPIGLSADPIILLPKNKVFAYPNPVEGSEVRIRYFVNQSGSVDIMIFDMAGEFVTKLLNSNIVQNEYNETVWNVKNVSSGVYLARVTAHGLSGGLSSKVIKVAVVK